MRLNLTDKTVVFDRETVRQLLDARALGRLSAISRRIV